jgi:CheY-like chemotaxis protein/predicted transcriptional regulator
LGQTLEYDDRVNALSIDRKMEKGIPSMADILNALSDDKALNIFKIIALSSCDSNILIREAKLNLKQYYSRMTDLIKVGLIRKKEGKYCLTSFGKVFYNLQIIAENTLSNYWKLKAIDSFDNLSKEEYNRFIDNLIDNHNIKEILEDYLSSCCAAINNIALQKTQVNNYQQQKQANPSSCKIILVDDEQDTLLTFKKFLLQAAASEGYTVDAFTDSYVALKHFISLNHSYYDLLIADIRMPGLNGLQLYQKMKAIDNTIKVVFVSALDALQEMVSIFPDLDFTNIIRKPVSQEDFIDKVKTALDA